MTLNPGVTHTYDVTVIANVASDSLPEAIEHPTIRCSEGPDWDRGGFRNVASLSVDGAAPIDRSVCASPEFPTAVKTYTDGSLTLNGDGTYTAQYEITVTAAENHATFYSLVDAPDLPAGVTFTATATDPDGDPVAGWTGQPGADELASAHPIAAGAEPQVWTITVTADVDTIQNIDEAACVADTSGRGFYNGGDLHHRVQLVARSRAASTSRSRG